MRQVSDSIVPYDDIIRRLPKALLLLFIYLLYGTSRLFMSHVVLAEYSTRYILFCTVTGNPEVF
jgi:hypothetical protein